MYVKESLITAVMRHFSKLKLCSESHNLPKAGYFVIIVLYIIMSRITGVLSNSQEVILMGNQMIPFSSLAGAFSSFSSMLMIFLVVFYGHIGFYTATAIILYRLFILINIIFVSHNFPTIPGIFTNFVTFLAIALIQRRNNRIDKFKESELSHLKEQQKFSQRLFEQTATALVSAIDAKDEYSRGHSQRVADYSEKIAKCLGKSEEDCRKIYYAALLHDVGKIGIADNIINKDCEPTEEEYKIIMEHPSIGEQILSSITEYPYLSIGAKYHHERYDGKGYPEGLKGEDIPEIARIIAVADTYDAMTSSRSYRAALPQLVASEELAKASGTQLDPVFVRVMEHVIDLDFDYGEMEKSALKAIAGADELVCKKYRDEVTTGKRITYYNTRVRFKCHLDEKGGRGPEIILFDSFDGRYHDDEATARELRYYEYCDMWMNGTISGKGVRKTETKVYSDKDRKLPLSGKDNGSADVFYEINAVKRKDHALITISDGINVTEHIIALPDSSRFVYLALSGENCTISGISADVSKEKIPDDYIPRIAEKISYIDVPQGDIPNVQIDSYRTDASKGILITDEMKISFHTMSLPTASLIWHCAYIVLFSSLDGTVNGENYVEYGLIRTDGEYWDVDQENNNKIVAYINDDFNGWDAWKKANKEGLDYAISIKKNNNLITVSTQNAGISIKNTTNFADMPPKIYAALTGDQCAITNIRINRA
ncbi:MAG: HD domain-containing protein [Butyrivibrio sp.]|nr:HD domain-containing protein [Butyrivibrio sp.]